MARLRVMWWAAIRDAADWITEFADRRRARAEADSRRQRRAGRAI